MWFAIGKMNGIEYVFKLKIKRMVDLVFFFGGIYLILSSFCSVLLNLLFIDQSRKINKNCVYEIAIFMGRYYVIYVF